MLSIDFLHKKCLENSWLPYWPSLSDFARRCYTDFDFYQDMYKKASLCCWSPDDYQANGLETMFPVPDDLKEFPCQYVDEATGEMVSPADVFRGDVPRWPNRVRVLRSLRSKWMNRLMMERNSSPALFVTLTVAPEFYFDVCLDPVLVLQKFFKRLRRRLDYLYSAPYGISVKEARQSGFIPSFKYFLVSEHGEQYGRLHFHMLLFGFEHRRGQKKFLENVWKYGIVDVKSVSPATIGYVTKYMFKRDCENGYVCLKSNGIGASYIEKHRVSLKRGIVHINGKTIYPDRYTKMKVMSESERISFNTKLSEQSAEKEREDAENISCFYLAKTADFSMAGSDGQTAIVLCRKLTSVETLRCMKWRLDEDVYLNISNLDKI